MLKAISGVCMGATVICLSGLLAVGGVVLVKDSKEDYTKRKAAKALAVADAGEGGGPDAEKSEA